MPRKTKTAAEAAAALPSIPKELIDQFVSGPMSAEAVNAASMAFKKALIERALGAELSHHLGYPHGAVRPEDERWQVGRDVRERQDIGVQIDPERVGHEPAPRPDPRPRLREPGSERLPQAGIGQGDPVLDVRREVVGAGGRDDVDLERHAGPQLDPRPG